MKITLMTLAAVLGSVLLVLFFHHMIFKPMRIIRDILWALKDGPKTADQIAALAHLNLKSAENFLEVLENKLKFIERRPHPALASSTFFRLTKLGEMEAERPDD
jgi:hypothetical protein